MLVQYFLSTDLDFISNFNISNFMSWLVKYRPGFNLTTFFFTAAFPPDT